jgi:hypothetical protein
MPGTPLHRSRGNTVVQSVDGRTDSVQSLHRQHIPPYQIEELERLVDQAYWRAQYHEIPQLETKSL